MVTTQFELQAMKVCMEEGMTMSNFFDEKICGKEREREGWREIEVKWRQKEIEEAVGEAKGDEKRDGERYHEKRDGERWGGKRWWETICKSCS